MDKVAAERWSRARERGFWRYLLIGTAQRAAVFIAGIVIVEWWKGAPPLRPDLLVEPVVMGLVMGLGLSVLNWRRSEAEFRRAPSGEPRCHDCGEVVPAHTRWCPSRWSGGWAPSRESK